MRMIISVDFDGILCKNKFPDIGEPNYEIISLVRQLKDKGHEIILWTSRVEKELESAIKWCENYGLHFDAINDNAPSNKEQYKGVYNEVPRKIYADIYIDDHNIEYVCGKDRLSSSNDKVIFYLRRLKGYEI